MQATWGNGDERGKPGIDEAGRSTGGRPGLSIAPPDLARPSFDAERHPALGLVRAQLVVVYGFSALNKVTHGAGRARSPSR